MHVVWPYSYAAPEGLRLWRFGGTWITGTVVVYCSYPSWASLPCKKKLQRVEYWQPMSCMHTLIHLNYWVPSFFLTQKTVFEPLSTDWDMELGSHWSRDVKPARHEHGAGTVGTTKLNKNQRRGLITALAKTRNSLQQNMGIYMFHVLLYYLHLFTSLFLLLVNSYVISS